MIPGAEDDVLGPRTITSVVRQADLLTDPKCPRGHATFLVLIEPTATGFSAYVPDLIGCVSTGSSVREVEANIREAISGNLEERRDAGCQIPTASVSAMYVDVIV